MRATTYDRISNGCVILAVLSALGFSELGHLQWVFGALAITAAVTAVGLYFWNQGVSNRCNSGAEEATLLKQQESTLVKQTSDDDLMQIRFEEIRKLVQFQLEEITKQVLYDKAAPLIHQRVVRGNRVNEIVDIVDRLSYASGEARPYEFVLTNSGDFLIRPASREKHRSGHGYVEEMDESVTPSETVPVQKPN